MPDINLDATDIRILNELQRDARLTNVELAARVNLSASPCLARVRRLETEGLIDRRVTLLNARKLGLKVNVFIQISLDKQRKAALDVFEREIAVLRLVAEGKANKEIAQALSLSEETVKAHLKNLFAKLDVNDRTHAVTIAVRRGIIEL